MVIFDCVKEINQTLRQKEIDFDVLADLYTTLRKMLEVLGIDINEIVLSDEDKEIYNKWNEAKSIKDFESADKYRAVLMEKGII